MKIFRKNNYLQIEFSDGSFYSNDDCTDAIWDFLVTNQKDENAVKKHLKIEVCEGKTLMDKVLNSNILTLRGQSVYMLGVSELSIPEDFVTKIIEAEENNNEEELKKYINFWTLISLNPDSRVRNNIFWFIRKWDMQITESGLIIAYRNADIQVEAKYSTEETKDIINSYYQQKYILHVNPSKELADAYNEIVNGTHSPVYTDMHSHTTEIKLGKPVSIPRNECDANQEHSCSQGLHCGAKGWLKQNYYGKVGLMVLVNPAKIVAVPTIDNYGKMRTCEYFPVALVDFDNDGNIIESEYNLYNDVAYLKQLKYEGNINNNDIDNYEISQVLSREDMYESILRRLREK